MSRKEEQATAEEEMQIKKKKGTEQLTEEPNITETPIRKSERKNKGVPPLETKV